MGIDYRTTFESESVTQGTIIYQLLANLAVEVHVIDFKTELCIIYSI